MRLATLVLLALALSACTIDSNPGVAVPHVNESSYVGAPGSTAP